MNISAIGIGSFVSWLTVSGEAKGCIKAIITDGRVPEIEAELYGTEQDPVALIEVWRSAGSGYFFCSEVKVGVPISLLTPIPPLAQIKLEMEDEEEDSAPGSTTDSVKSCAHPHDTNDLLEGVSVVPEVEEIPSEALIKFNQVAGAAVGLPPVSSHELIIVPFLAADNLLNRSLSRWRKKELDKMQSLLIGMPFTLDHDWGEVGKSQGIVFDAQLCQGDANDRALGRAGNFDINRKICKDEGHWGAIAWVGFQSYLPLIESIRFGRVGNVSMGGFAYKDHICPICNISFDNPKCPHGIPDPMMGWTSETDDRIAPYYIRDGIYDLGELSAVLVPNLPEAGVIKRDNWRGLKY